MSEGSYTREFKLAVLRHYKFGTPLKVAGVVVPISKYAVAGLHNIHLTVLSRWIAGTVKITSQLKDSRKLRQTSNDTRREQKPELERLLHEQLLDRRAKRVRVAQRWIIRTAKNIYNELHPQLDGSRDEALQANKLLKNYSVS